MPILTGVDLLGIQRYVFGSNRLRDAIGASPLVEWATSPDGALAGLTADPPLLAAGGNVLLEFPDLEAAKRFGASYSRRLYDKTPGLDAAVAHRAFKQGQLARAVQALQVELARTKTERQPGAPLLGLGVTAACRETGLPAHGFDHQDPSDPDAPLSRSILAMRRATRDQRAGARWTHLLEQAPVIGGKRPSFPDDLDHLGRTTGELSLFGVVHVDGNDVGSKIKAWLQNCLDDDAVRAGYRQWSPALDHMAASAMDTVMRRLSVAIGEDEGQVKVRGAEPATADLEFQLRSEDSSYRLPFRPVLAGGDDLTFVCDGRIALDLAVAVLEAFEASEIPDLGHVLACAGIAICRTHTPFARAYALAEDLCATAKRWLREHNLKASALDWHIGAPPPSARVADVRRGYTTTPERDEADLTCRPYLLSSETAQAPTWQWLRDELLGTDSAGLRGQHWRDHRNKALALGDLVRGGPEAVQQALDAWSAVDGQAPLPPRLRGGFLDGRTPLLDARELLDLYLPLPTEG